MRLKAFIYLFILSIFWGCGNNDYIPKRVGYFRIALPDKNYSVYSDEHCPFTFEYPQYSKVQLDSTKRGKTAWLNLIFSRFRCNLYLSYAEVDTNLSAYIEESRKMVTRHEIKAEGINEREVTNSKDKVYGSIYEIEGNTATNYQFYLTDSTKNFIRGALYFYAVPNKDSIEPVLNFVKEDVIHLINTFKWKE